MKKTIIAAVLAVTAGSAFGAEFAELAAFKASEIEYTVPQVPVPAEVKAWNDAAGQSLEKTKRAHKTTWFTLTTLEFIPMTPFGAAGGLIVDDGQDSYSGHLLAARQLDLIFVEIRGAKRVEGVDQVRVIAQALSRKDLNVRAFAELMDSLYTFYGE